MHTPSPPRLFIRFFRWFCNPELHRFIEGDLIELYQKRTRQSGKRIADFRFALDVLLLLRPSLIGRKTYYPVNHTDMLKHYLTVGWRNLTRNKGYSMINIGGLAMGMTVAMLIGLWVYDEVSFNTYHKNYEHIAQVRRRATDPHTGLIRGGEAIQFPAGTAIRNTYTDYFKHALLAFWPGDFTLTSGDKKLMKHGQFIDGGVIDMLSLDMVQGTSASLNDPHSIILSESTARTFFGDADPMGKPFKIVNWMDVQVTGVYKDLPANTAFGANQFFAPWELWVMSNEWVKQAENNWGNTSFLMYVQLKDGVSLAQAQAGIKDFYIQYGSEEYRDDYIEWKQETLLYPMAQWHLYSDFENGLPAGGWITFVWLFGIVGVFVLLLACINFMNLSTARSEKRAKEVGVRKAIGSAKQLLVNQFISESFIVVIIAFLISIALCAACMPAFNRLAAKDLQLPFGEPVFWVISLLFVMITGLLASVYPAFYLSSFQPIKVLKGTFRLGRFASVPRKVLVVIQFTVSVTLIIGTVIVHQQIEHARNRPTGYDREGIISISRNDPGYTGKEDVLRTEVMNTGVISEMAMSSSPLTQVWNNIGGFEWTGKNPELPDDFSVTHVTPEFGRTIRWEFIAGRDFDKNLRSDSAALVINETAAKYLGLTNPVGELIKQGGSTRTWQIIGVIKDMIMTSPYEPEKRAFFLLDHDGTSSSQVHMKIRPDVSTPEAVDKIKSVFAQIVPTASFDYRFVDADYAAKFAQEERIGKLTSIFALLAIFISCLGLFGLASFVAEQRTKEIGIRKVLGASVFNLWRMLSKDFVFLVIISILIAAPVALYLMNGWLKHYQYRIEVSWLVFIVSGSGAVLITLITVSFQSIRAAVDNPVKSLRSE